ncbi:MAG: virulence factor family protein [Gammaproteobacteria bacterium]|nr:virulence factor family protein [Gammaproteobacteria bacterium]
MKSANPWLALLLYCACAGAFAAPTARRAPTRSATPSAPASSALIEHYERFGAITVYPSVGEPHDFVIFLSGDGGWHLGVISMAKRLASHGAIVAGVDMRHYLKALRRERDRCVSPDVDFENLSHYLQAKLGVKHYLQPSLVGYSSGATLAYATLVESPDGLFKGALSLGFCPDLDLIKPLCAGSGIHATPRRNARGVLKGVNFLPAKSLPGRWISLQGEIDQVCPIEPTAKFMAQVPGAQMVRLPKVGHGFGVERNWVPQYVDAFERLTAEAPPVLPAAQAAGSGPGGAAASAADTPAMPAAGSSGAAASLSRAGGALAGPLAGRAVDSPSVADLPLTVVPAAAGRSSPWFGVFLSGDGGWVGIDRSISAALAARGIPMVGWDSLRYFWTPRTPEGAARDLDRVIAHYGRLFGKSRVLLVGYSQGADTLPFMVNRLPSATAAQVGLTALLALSDRADFEFHIANWLGSSRGGIPTAPELAHWRGAPYLCLYGKEDHEAACAHETVPPGVRIEMPGGHHFDGSYAAIAERILAHLPSR